MSGAGIAVDNPGAGRFSLELFRLLPIDTLGIGEAFVCGSDRSSARAGLMHGVSDRKLEPAPRKRGARPSPARAEPRPTRKAGAGRSAGEG